MSEPVGCKQPDHEAQDISGQSLWSRLPDEIKQEILQDVFSGLTVKFRGKPDSVTQTKIQGTKHSNVELRKAPQYLLPNLFLISKTMINKDEVVDAIVRAAHIRFQTTDAVENFSTQLIESQRQVLKRITIKQSRLLPSGLHKKIGRHAVCLVDPLAPNGPGPIKSNLRVPSHLLTETSSPTFIGPSPPSTITDRSFRLEDPSRFDELPVTMEAMMALLFIQDGISNNGPSFINTKLGHFIHAAYKQNIEVTVEFDLKLETVLLDGLVEDSEFRAVFSTTDWAIRASNGKINFTLSQCLSKQIFDKKLTEDGVLRDPDFNVRKYIWRKGIKQLFAQGYDV